MLMQYNRFDDLMDSYREHKTLLDAIRSNKQRITGIGQSK